MEAAYIRDIWAIHLYRDVANINYHDNGDSLISNELREWILKNGIPKGFERRKRTKKDAHLPLCIFFKHETQEYFYQKKFNNKFHRKYGFKTQKDCENALYELVERLKREELEEKRKNVTKTKDGIHCIRLKKKDKTYEFLVDKDVWYDIIQYTWSLTGDFKYAYSSNVDGEHYRMHVYIHEKYIGPIPKGKTVDHRKAYKNYDKNYDNRIKNLRALTSKEQTYNTDRKKRNIPIPYRGVYLKRGKFHAQIDHIFLDQFDTMEEAALAYNEAAIEIYKDIAILNDITTSNTTFEILFPKEIVTLEFVKNIDTITMLRELFRIRQDWKEENNIAYMHIKGKTFKKYKEIAIKLAEEEFGTE